MTSTDSDTESALENLRHCISEYLSSSGITDPQIIGIHTGGVWIARMLADYLGSTNPIGELDISFYRDDFSQIGLNPQVRPSRIPFDIDGRHILLVDDVIYTGRTIRAALNEIFDFGRPASVTLAVLVERDGRQLPIRADCVGKKITLSDHQQIKLGGPDDLTLAIVDTQ